MMKSFSTFTSRTFLPGRACGVNSNSKGAKYPSCEPSKRPVDEDVGLVVDALEVDEQCALVEHRRRDVERRCDNRSRRGPSAGRSAESSPAATCPLPANVAAKSARSSLGFDAPIERPQAERGSARRPTAGPGPSETARDARRCRCNSCRSCVGRGDLRRRLEGRRRCVRRHRQQPPNQGRRRRIDQIPIAIVRFDRADLGKPVDGRFAVLGREAWDDNANAQKHRCGARTFLIFMAVTALCAGVAHHSIISHGKSCCQRDHATYCTKVRDSWCVLHRGLRPSSSSSVAERGAVVRDETCRPRQAAQRKSLPRLAF